jgi:hypothetical protein
MAAAVAANQGLFRERNLRMENEIMRTKNLIHKTSSRPGLNWVTAISVLALLVSGTQLSLAQKSGPETFSSAGKASSALFQAVQNNDEEAMERILGAGKEVTSSRDQIEDKLERERFRQKYQEMHRLVREPDGTTVLYIGAENWPFPIPLVSKNGAWFFDSDTGKEEILFRTIGENETTAIHVCHVLAQGKERSETEPAAAGPIIQYAQSLVNSDAANAGDTARAPGNQPATFHGYYFRSITGNSAAGALALVAYPADYRSSGVMTFMVTKNGKVYEKDLGSETTTLAQGLRRGPDSSWHVVE